MRPFSTTSLSKDNVLIIFIGSLVVRLGRHQDFFNFFFFFFKYINDQRLDRSKKLFSRAIGGNPDEQRNLRNGPSNLLHPEQLVATNRNRARSATGNFTDASGESFVGGFPIQCPRGNAFYVTSFHLPISRECQGSRCNFTLKHDSCVYPFLPREPAVETSRDHRLSNELKLGQVRISRGNTCNVFVKRE